MNFVSGTFKLLSFSRSWSSIVPKWLLFKPKNEPPRSWGIQKIFNLWIAISKDEISFHDELDKILSAWESAFKEPHDNHVMGQRDGVVVELEGVGVGKGDGENRHVLIVVKTGKHLISRKKIPI